MVEHTLLKENMAIAKNCQANRWKGPLNLFKKANQKQITAETLI